jgi:hypothetical protein
MSTANICINYGFWQDEAQLPSCIRHTMKFITTQLP